MAEKRLSAKSLHLQGGSQRLHIDCLSGNGARYLAFLNTSTRPGPY